MKHDARDVGPVRAFRIGVEKAKIRDKVLPIVIGEGIRLGSLVGNGRIERWWAHIIPASPQELDEIRPGEWCSESIIIDPQ
jgi:hypothetical protein